MAEFILKDWYGKEKSFDHETVYFQDAEGNLLPFTHGTGNPTLEDLEVTENGNYTPSEGVDGFSSVSVNVPDPEIKLQDKTITENGTYTADSDYDGLGSVTVEVAGSGGGAKFNYGYFSADGTAKEIEHGLGVVPDFILITNDTTTSMNGAYARTVFGFSDGLRTKLGTTLALAQRYITVANSTNYTTGRANTLVNGTNTNYIHNANENTFTIPSNSAQRGQFMWIAFSVL